MAKNSKKCGEQGKRRPYGIIDIGSNSVRLVVYDGLTRHPHVVFNEKVLCGLGRAVGRTGNMDGEAMDRALRAIRRFARLCKHMKVKTIDAVATAAVRDAKNGTAFISQVEGETGILVRIISGEEEARLSAIGVIAGIPEAHGIVGDLGGGSLELVRIEGGEPQDRVTLPIGPVRLLGDFGDDLDKQRDVISKAIASVSWLDKAKGQSFYIVGGAWRAISRIHMDQERWPLPILQGYCIPRDRARAYCDLIAHQHIESLAANPNIPARRLEVLPLASIILERCLDAIKPRDVTTSSLGLREGLIFDALSDEVKAEHPFISECRELAQRGGRFPEHAEQLMTWIDPLFSASATETGPDRQLRLAACLLSDISWRGHPDFRAERAVMELLYGRFVGIDHRGRALVGLALNYVYGASANSAIAGVCHRLLDDKDQRYAQMIGLALRLGHRLSGGTAKVLKRSGLRLDDRSLVLSLREDMADLAGEIVQRRLNSLAQAFNWEAKIVLTPQPAKQF